MPKYVVDPTLFHAEGAIVNWTDAAKRLGLPRPGGPNGDLPPVIELRWMLRGTLGLPTEPFQVWSRPHLAQSIQQNLNLKSTNMIFAGNTLVVSWTNGSMSTVVANILAPFGGIVWAFAGAPIPSNLVAFATIPAGSTVISLAGSIIEGLIFTAGITVTSAIGIETGALTQAAGWNPIELVGIPVKQSDWPSIGKHGEPQGLTGSLTDAQTAAVQRLRRGAPPVGWAATLAAGVAAPPWSPPDFLTLITEVNTDVLNPLRPIAAGFPPNQHGAQKINIPLPPPQNSSGKSMTVAGGTSQVAPLAMLLMAASTDPFLNLALGYGTAYPSLPDVTGARNAFDYMITAHYECGMDGASGAADFAAIVPAPSAALPPPPPANLVTPLLGTLRPLFTDGSWRASTRISWDRPGDSQLFRVASFAAARAGISPSTPTAALMEKRVSGGFRSISINNATTTPPDPEAWRLHATDHELPIPTNPGSCLVKYATAIQDIYGQWTPWTAADDNLQQPPLDRVRIARAELRPTLPPVGSVCPASLEIEFLWDWRIRSLQQVSFAGYLFAAATTGDPPPSFAVPPGLPRSLGGAQPPLVISFNGADTPSAPAGVTVKALNEAGDAEVSFGAAQGLNRRFRVILSGLALDFAPTGHIGLALWAQGQEHIPPQRFSPWSAEPGSVPPTYPTIISTSDPRPPVVPVQHVTLASLPDAAGQCHTGLGWVAQPNANGYFVYEANETILLQFYGLHEATPDQTLDQRLLILKNAFDAHPDRTIATPFTRMNSTLLQGTSTDVVLPRGSTGIHLYVVLGVSAGGVEGGWPKIAVPPDGTKPSDSLSAIAAPHIMQPAAPTIEVNRFFDSAAAPPAFKASITIKTRPGSRPAKLDLHRVRVDDAAKELDSMGPPLVHLNSSNPVGWTVQHAVDSNGKSFIVSAAGNDAPSGSWRRVWYRVTAWTDTDLTRGALPGRSPTSNAAWVVLPPPDAPILSPLSFGAGPTPADFIVQWSSASPLKKTPLGPHRIAARALLAGAPPKSIPLFALDSTLDQIGATPPASGSGVWISSLPGASPVVYRALVRRDPLSGPVKFSVRITDPIARTGEQFATIAPGPVNPAPDLSALTVQKIPGTPARILLTFSSSVPLSAPLDGPYSIRVVATFKKIIIFFPAPTRTIDLAVGSIPTVAAPPGPPPFIQLVRNPGPGPLYTYTVLCFGNVVSFHVKISASDGRYAEKTQIVS